MLGCPRTVSVLLLLWTQSDAIQIPCAHEARTLDAVFRDDQSAVEGMSDTLSA